MKVTTKYDLTDFWAKGDVIELVKTKWSIKPFSLFRNPTGKYIEFERLSLILSDGRIYGTDLFKKPLEDIFEKHDLEPVRIVNLDLDKSSEDLQKQVIHNRDLIENVNKIIGVCATPQFDRGFRLYNYQSNYHTDEI